MAYEKLNLANGTVLNEEHLAHIEAGIANSGGIGAVSEDCVASGAFAHAEGQSTKATSLAAHAEGYYAEARDPYSHAEGLRTESRGPGSHSEGAYTKAIGEAAHAEGYYTEARGHYSHAEGKNTIARSSSQHVQGEYNVEDAEEKYAHIVGNGYYISENGVVTGDVRSNAHTLDWNGVPWFQGRPQFGGNAQDDGSKTVMANGDTEITLTDRTTGVKYNLYIDNGKLMMEEVS